MPRMATEILPTNLADVGRVAPVVPAALVVPEDPVELAVRAALVVPEDPVELAVQAALVVPEDPVELAVQAALVVPEDPVELAVQVALVVPESPAVLVALAVRAVRGVLVVSENPAVPVALERELVQVEAELVRDRPRVQLAVALRTKSVIAAHPHDLVPLLAAEEDLAAAVAETTREPAAAEAVKHGRWRIQSRWRRRRRSQSRRRWRRSRRRRWWTWWRWWRWRTPKITERR